ncbi:MAG: cytochrome c oxidase subunit 3 [Hymenobacteraceae bacterium]|nr:cytochrome c oxidase subunit 3 [Hymenobacteraceae bacterium]
MTEFLTSAELDRKEPSFGVHPLKFLLWLMIISSTMSFAAYTSGYIVRKGEGNWLEFALPARLYVSSVVILLSSFTMQGALVAARRDNVKLTQLLLVATLLLGGVFLASQWQAWGELVASNIFFAGPTSNPAGSFLYVLTGFHAFHLFCALVFLTTVLRLALQYKVHSKALLWIDLCTIFWHFLGALWLYLHLFLLLNR